MFQKKVRKDLGWISTEANVQNPLKVNLWCWMKSEAVPIFLWQNLIVLCFFVFEYLSEKAHGLLEILNWNKEKGGREKKEKERHTEREIGKEKEKKMKEQKEKKKKERKKENRRETERESKRERKREKNRKRDLLIKYCSSYMIIKWVGFLQILRSWQETEIVETRSLYRLCFVMEGDVADSLPYFLSSAI